jgi:hypothetical protein
MRLVCRNPHPKQRHRLLISMLPRAAMLLALIAAFGMSLAVHPARASDVPNVSEWTVLQRMSLDTLKAWAATARPDANGATSMNRTGYIQVGFQRDSVNAIPYSIRAKNVGSLGNSFRIIRYAFQHQRPDGGFEYSESNGQVSSGYQASRQAEASNAAYFLYDLGHTLLLLQQSDWFQHSAETATFRSQLQQVYPNARRALDWLVAQQDVLRGDTGGANRTLGYASAYYLTGKALNSSSAMAVGRTFIQGALDKQLSDGTFPELGGFDSSYQGVSLYQGMILFLQMDSSEGDLRARLWNAVQRADSREASAVLSSGEVSTAANTRVRAGGEAAFGHAKSIDAITVSMALQYFAFTINNPKSIQTAQAVFHHYFGV